ncbi:FadR/GntR family transcriptional regulator [Metabacillus sp. 84]|uniref:FadR/GntR family transcriptional regulator n=1 Tax=unclassified Metabacillus TaxID=2675274 RepID=UPI003CEC7515
MPGPKSRVYEETLQQIRLIIKKDGLLPGDKIPSERELADRLDVGRSSVREALRALELLGMIETKRGEGTYIKDFRENHLVSVLGLFVLEDCKAVEDILEMSALIEKHALLKIMESSVKETLVHLEQDLRNGEAGPQELMGKLIKLADNHLLYRTWSILSDYLKAGSRHMDLPLPVYEELLSGLILGNKNLVLQTHEKISKNKIVQPG